MHLLAQLDPALMPVVTEPATKYPTYTIDQVLSPYMWVLMAAFAMTFITTPIMRKLALANGIVDWPDLKRKAHLEPVAYLGGVGIFLGWFVGILASMFIIPHTAGELGMSASVDFPMSILVGAIIIMMVGLFDDIYGISPRVKIGGQLLAAALLAMETVGTSLIAGIITSVFGVMGLDPHIIPGFGHEIVWLDPSYWLGTIFLMLLVLGGCNSINLIDGLDGLASGVTGIAALFFGVIAVALAMGLYGPDGAYSPYQYDPVRIVMCLAILGAMLGFLPYNFNPANIFMGDCGSLLLGYLLVTVILLLAEKGDPNLVMAGLVVIAVPALDTLLAIVRRKMRGQPIFSPDNQHLHHQLKRAGCSVKQAVLVLYGAAVLFGLIGSSMIFLRMRYAGTIFLVMFGFIIVMAYKVGHRQHLLILEAEKRGRPAATPVSEAPAEPTPGQSPETNADGDANPPAGSGVAQAT
jgi:UDP-GlcNAc:undecaprenyl-phosphate GlcNAc-1-phosphate transferase